MIQTIMIIAVGGGLSAVSGNVFRQVPIHLGHPVPVPSPVIVPHCATEDECVGGVGFCVDVSKTKKEKY